MLSVGPESIMEIAAKHTRAAGFNRAGDGKILNLNDGGFIPSDLESRFDEEMFLIYERAKTECGYHATRFLNMLHERGGVHTAKYLLHAPTLSDGSPLSGSAIDWT
jgi:hypothetical protein